jgi:hypothetical protein
MHGIHFLIFVLNHFTTNVNPTLKGNKLNFYYNVQLLKFVVGELIPRQGGQTIIFDMEAPISLSMV